MSETLALDAAWIFAVFLVGVVLAAATIAGRRVLLDRGGGTVECGLRRPGGAGRLGVAAYGADELRWYNGVGVLLTPEEVLSRRTLSITSRRDADAAEAVSLGPGMVVVGCQAGESADTIELAMGEAALTGVLAGLEAAPARVHYRWVVCS